MGYLSLEMSFSTASLGYLGQREDLMSGGKNNMGLFLGAGSSYEVGMPLVWEFSSTLRKNILSRLNTKLFDFKGNDGLRNDFVSLLSDVNKHYEEVVGELESLYFSKKYDAQEVWGVIIQLVECIQLLLLEEQENTAELLKLKSIDYYGIISLLKYHKVFDVFSLNHDLVMEEICNFYKIPYKDGFYEVVTNYDHITDFGVLNKEQIDKKEYNFFESGEVGINIIKLHGSLDTFAAEDKRLYLKTRGKEGVAGSCITAVRDLENAGMKFMTENSTRATNELLVTDKRGEIQMLRRSLLSGANKFKGKFEQIIPVSFMEIFRERLWGINNLSVVGYSFGDSHINDVLDGWMAEGNRKITIYDPFRKNPPESLAQHERNILLIQGGFTDFCLSQDSSLESEELRSIRSTLINKREELRVRRSEA